MSLSRAYAPRVFAGVGIPQHPKLSTLGQRIASIRGPAGWIQDGCGWWWTSAAEILAYEAELELIDRMTP